MVETSGGRMSMMKIAGGLAVVLVAKMQYDKWLAKQEVRKRQELRKVFIGEKLAEVGERVAVRPTFVASDGFMGLGVAWDFKKLIVLSATFQDKAGNDLPSPRLAIRALDARDLISVEIIDDSYRKPGKASAKRLSQGIYLKINVMDGSAPVIVVRFLGDAAATDAPEYLEAIERVREWEGLILALIHRQAREPSVSDQLRELSELNRLGSISNDEYNTQKERLLTSQFGKLALGTAEQPTLREVQGES